jgi:hypothetical protein
MTCPHLCRYCFTIRNIAVRKKYNIKFFCSVMATLLRVRRGGGLVSTMTGFFYVGGITTECQAENFIFYSSHPVAL